MKNRGKNGFILDLYRVRAALDVVLSLDYDFPREKIDSILELAGNEVDDLIENFFQIEREEMKSEL